MNRQGYAIVMSLAFASLLSIGAIAVTRAMNQRQRETAARAQRIEAREFALGAAALAPDSSLQLGEWTLMHSRGPQGSEWTASGPRGTYAIIGAEEIWSPRRKDPR